MPIRGDGTIPLSLLRGVSNEQQAPYRAAFCIGGVFAEIIAIHENDATLIPSLEPFRTAFGMPDIQIHIEWVSRIEVGSTRPLFDSGYSWRLYESHAGFQFDFYVPAFGTQPYKRLIIDDRFRMATIQMNRASCLGTPLRLSPLAYPLDELLIMHRLTQEKGIELHGCGIVTANGIGNLFVGHSGAGKSTTTRLWTEHEGVKVLSDDRIIVRRNGTSPVDHRVQPGRNGKRRKMRMYGTPWHGEAMFALPESAPLRRIVILEHGHGNVLTRLSSGQAVAELFARSFVPLYRHEYVETALEFLRELSDAVPCYHYAFEPNQRAVEKILDLHD